MTRFVLEIRFDVFDQDRCREEIVYRNVEKTLDLPGMQVKVTTLLCRRLSAHPPPFGTHRSRWDAFLSWGEYP